MTRSKRKGNRKTAPATTVPACESPTQAGTPTAPAAQVRTDFVPRKRLDDAQDSDLTLLTAAERTDGDLARAHSPFESRAGTMRTQCTRNDAARRELADRLAGGGEKPDGSDGWEGADPEALPDEGEPEALAALLSDASGADEDEAVCVEDEGEDEGEGKADGSAAASGHAALSKKRAPKSKEDREHPRLAIGRIMVAKGLVPPSYLEELEEALARERSEKASPTVSATPSAPAAGKKAQAPEASEKRPEPRKASPKPKDRKRKASGKAAAGSAKPSEHSERPMGGAPCAHTEPSVAVPPEVGPQRSESPEALPGSERTETAPSVGGATETAAPESEKPENSEKPEEPKEPKKPLSERSEQSELPERDRSAARALRLADHVGEAVVRAQRADPIADLTPESPFRDGTIGENASGRFSTANALLPVTDDASPGVGFPNAGAESLGPTLSPFQDLTALLEGALRSEESDGTAGSDGTDGTVGQGACDFAFGGPFGRIRAESSGETPASAASGRTGGAPASADPHADPYAQTRPANAEKRSAERRLFFAQKTDLAEVENEAQALARRFGAGERLPAIEPIVGRRPAPAHLPRTLGNGCEGADTRAEPSGDGEPLPDPVLRPLVNEAWVSNAEGFVRAAYAVAVDPELERLALLEARRRTRLALERRFGPLVAPEVVSERLREAAAEGLFILPNASEVRAAKEAPRLPSAPRTDTGNLPARMRAFLPTLLPTPQGALRRLREALPTAFLAGTLAALLLGSALHFGAFAGGAQEPRLALVDRARIEERVALERLLAAGEAGFGTDDVERMRVERLDARAIAEAVARTAAKRNLTPLDRRAVIAQGPPETDPLHALHDLPDITDEVLTALGLTPLSAAQYRVLERALERRWFGTEPPGAPPPRSAVGIGRIGTTPAAPYDPNGNNYDNNNDYDTDDNDTQGNRR